MLPNDPAPIPEIVTEAIVVVDLVECMATSNLPRLATDGAEPNCSRRATTAELCPLQRRDCRHSGAAVGSVEYSSYWPVQTQRLSGLARGVSGPARHAAVNDSHVACSAL